MTDILEKSSNWLESQRNKHRTKQVTYKRGADSVEVNATIGRTAFEVSAGYGVLEKFESRDFLVNAADLVLASAPTLPERGDQVQEVQDGNTYVYEVMAPGKEPHYRFSDPYRQTLRIHTKLVDTLDSEGS